MRIMEADGGGFVVPLDRDEVIALGGRIDGVRSWSREMGLAMEVARDGDDARIRFPDRSVALSFLGRCVPGGLADVARPLAEGIADYAEVAERDGAVEVTIRYVGDAGSGTGQEPHDRTSEDFAGFAELAREAGFDVEHRHSDHDTIEALLTPIAPDRAATPDAPAMAR
jgi:hypothetical protein